MTTLLKKAAAVPFLTIAFLSFAVLLLELVEIRLLSFLFWNHLVYLTISVALLGFGISGSLVAMFSEKWLEKKTSMSWLIIGFGYCAILVLGATAMVPLLVLATAPVKILFCYLAYVGPFIFGGAAISVLLAQNREQVGQLYAVDLLFAGLACCLFFFLLPILGPAMITALVALASGILAIIWALSSDSGEQSALPPSKLLSTAIGIELVASLAAVILCNSMSLMPESYKEFYQIATTPGNKIERTIWTPLCRVDIMSNTTREFLSHTFEFSAGQSRAITQDGTANTVLPGKEAINQLLEQIKEDKPRIYAPALVYRIKEKPKVAVIGVGGGVDVIEAFGYGASRVVGAELNPAIFRMTTSAYADFNGHFFEKPEISITNKEGRNMLRHLKEKFDVIQFVAIDTFAALSSGAYVLSENYLYTVEALNDMFDRLTPDGLISTLRWTTDPPRESLRLTSLACEALRQRQCNTIDQQILVVRQDRWALNVVKNSPFTTSEINEILAGAKRHNMQILYLPKVLENQRQTEAMCAAELPEESRKSSKIWNQLVTSYQKGDQSSFFNQYQYLVSPTTDDSPFFFEYHHKHKLGSLDIHEQRGNTALITLYLVMGQAVAFIFFAIFLPLFTFRRQGILTAGVIPYSLYFSSVGFGFMLIEVTLIQKCVLFLGNPIFSLSVVLATLLASAGAGSYLATKTGWSFRKVILVFGTLLICFFTGLVFSSAPIFNTFLDLPLAGRMGITTLLLFPSGLLLGAFFPTGLSAVQKEAPGYIPWAWGINGATSVFGSFAAIMLAILIGFTNTLLIGAATYLLAIISALIITSKPEPN